MKRVGFRYLVIAAIAIATFSDYSLAWQDETHIAIAKAARYRKWYNACGADMTKIKAGNIEAHNHYTNNPPGTIVTNEMVMRQARQYNRVDDRGHLYGAIIASLRDYLRDRREGKYTEYHLAFCIHYVGDLSQPLHNIAYDSFNRKNHKRIDEIIDDDQLENLQMIDIYPITIVNEKGLVREIVRIANISLRLGYKIEAENRALSKEEAYRQIGHSASLIRAILEFAGKGGRRAKAPS